eukprot:CAMPEP_0117650368 /NCGR_PEP_ID=MMETSP0804-20121206/1501_1 /TAXON_ID=1074897 /ORGANISM="Tetraselmis astigmatica, Strain CCMP880" /LENGTH=369 /DNA_ID=CAMNT_0005456233 /DNA_START=6 /DNA_END=1112 /DNA_ORIENTATION=-
MGTENLSLYDKWFRLADEDHDGKVGGAEAVKFFQKSSLPQPSLAQIWQIASNGAPALGKPQFNGAMQLVSLAQQSGGTIDPGIARQVMIGLGPKLPPPRMAGLPVPYTPGAPSPGAAGGGGAGWGPGGGGMMGQGAAFPSSGSTGGYFSQQHFGTFPASGPTGMMAPGHPGSGPSGPSWAARPGPPSGAFPGAGATGGYGMQGMGGGGSQGPSAGPGTPGGLPPMTATEEQLYSSLFARLDQGHTGAVQGQSVFPLFSSSGLPRDTLRDIWGLVAGNRGSLTQEEFVTAHYLLDCARRGCTLPNQLPAAGFPPRAGAAWPPGQQMGPRGSEAPQQEDPLSAVNDAFASLGASLGVPQHLLSGSGARGAP